MTIQQTKERAVIVSGSDKGSEYFRDLLAKHRFEIAAVFNSSEEARRFLSEREADVLIINTPLRDDFGLQMALDVAADSDVGVLLIVKGDAYEQVIYRTEQTGVLTLAKPLSATHVLQALHLLSAARFKLRALERKTATLESKMEEIRLVAHAKLLLIDQMKMTEAEAHRYIERHAMDACVKRREIASRIIDKYDKN
mgnify:CR=1 FL=1